MLVMPILASMLALDPPPLRELLVGAGVTEIGESARLVLQPGSILPRGGNSGAIRVVADDIVLDFAAGSVLRGADADVQNDTISGVGILIKGHRHVTIRNARIEGFKVGILATNADGLRLEDCRIEHGFRQRLKSTPQGEEEFDWLSPHKNDDHEWIVNYGTAVCIERSTDVRVSGLRVRSTQNGLILDRVNGSTITDCDCSFLSGWGLAMWRSSGNTISRNALDFCVRGYSHGVYNRGQDSAGILCFEQCSSNRFVQNSATHGGDGFFGFAGREALGESPAPSDNFDHLNRGCNGNVLLGNDFSDAAAHGIEMTFSFDNRFESNRLVSDAICGVWAGYSQRTLIMGNTIERCGDPALTPGSEGGGINIEHGVKNRIVRNKFTGNTTAISLWAGDNPSLLKTAWAAANHRGSSDNSVAMNEFTDENRFLRLRNTRSTSLSMNTFVGAATEPDTDNPAEVHPAAVGADDAGNRSEPEPDPHGLGEAHPVGARPQLAGREHIIMGEWGPWDGESPMLRLASRTSGRAVYELYGDVGAVSIKVTEGAGDLETELGAVEPDQPRTLTLRPRVGIGALPFTVRVNARGIDETLSGVLLNTRWTAAAFAFKADPRTDLEAWRAESRSASAVVAPCDDLGWMRSLANGPRSKPIFAEAGERAPGGTNFGVVARTTLELPPGRWRIATLSDDGVRVLVGGKAIIEHWTHHAPERDGGEFEQTASGPVEIVVEYFQLDGYATLEFDLAREPGPVTPR